jgi:hypothetical protein
VTEQNNEKPERRASAPTEIRTGNIPNTGLERYLQNCRRLQDDDDGDDDDEHMDSAAYQ